MRIMKTTRLFLMMCSIIILNMGAPIQAAEKDTTPTAPTHFGTIDETRMNKGEIIIGDILYPIVSYAKVHPSNKYMVFVPESLKQNMTIGFRMEPVTGIAEPAIVEVWALDSLPKEDTDD